MDNCLFRTVTSNKNADPNKYGYSGYGIGFGALSQFSLPDGSWGKNVIIFELTIVLVCMLIIKKDNLAHGESPTQGLDNTTKTTEAKYPINFTKS